MSLERTLCDPFWDDAVSYMIGEYGLGREEAIGLVERYGEGIDVRNEVIQHLGPDYIAIQMMMVEGLLEYESM